MAGAGIGVKLPAERDFIRLSEGGRGGSQSIGTMRERVEEGCEKDGARGIVESAREGGGDGGAGGVSGSRRTGNAGGAGARGWELKQRMSLMSRFFMTQ